MMVVRRMLEQDGYTGLDTGLPLNLVKGGGIDLVLTDVMMPVMKGTELAPRVEAISPQTKVLLMSAYVLSEVTASRRPFLAKPCPRQGRARAVGPAFSPHSVVQKTLPKASCLSPCNQTP